MLYYLQIQLSHLLELSGILQVGDLKMKRVFILLVLLGMLIPAAAVAEIVLSADTLAQKSILDFTIEGENAPLYRYTVYREDEKLFSHETKYGFGSYVPRATGAYTLMAEAVYDEERKESSEAVFTVVEQLTCDLLVREQTLYAGEPLRAEVTANGGCGGYRYLYTVTADGKQIIQQESGPEWYWAPGEEGGYTLIVTVMDESGSTVSAKADFTAETGPGLSAEPTGGALQSHGGQKSWIIFAPEGWMAKTDCDFITLENAAGEPGDALVVSISEETDEYREGIVTITSAGKSIELIVGQSGHHGVEEEVSLFAQEGMVLADGKVHNTWLNAQGSQTFTIAADGLWEIETDAFIHAEAEGDQLTVTVEESNEKAVRFGMVHLSCGSASAYIHLYQQPAEQADAGAGLPPIEAADGFTLYSQSSGLWKEQKYGVSTLEHSGCAIFALSHALECLGYEGEEILPPALAKKYAFCLRDGGTINSTLIGNAGDDFGYKTRYELYEELDTIRSRTQQGAVWSFSVVNGHIAMIAEMSEDGSMFRVIDSAPSATWERIQNAQLYRREADGSFTSIQALTELDDMRYFIENGAFSGATYWLEDRYVARRGVRLIQRKED